MSQERKKSLIYKVLENLGRIQFEKFMGINNAIENIPVLHLETFCSLVFHSGRINKALGKIFFSKMFRYYNRLQ